MCLICICVCMYLLEGGAFSPDNARPPLPPALSPSPAYASASASSSPCAVHISGTPLIYGSGAAVVVVVVSICPPIYEYMPARPRPSVGDTRLIVDDGTMETRARESLGEVGEGETERYRVIQRENQTMSRFQARAWWWLPTPSPPAPLARFPGVSATRRPLQPQWPLPRSSALRILIKIKASHQPMAGLRLRRGLDRNAVCTHPLYIWCCRRVPPIELTASRPSGRPFMPGLPR
ncbi:uncharacterized protein LY79DRAFT_9996 [Colletotrichum navitas]|uniref:Uncharacterized protein n=1 Tax=Colletotrichum navitas TaxID=681940 RepID=A0AAD8QCV0_9PEZI|nr:uncharacterized protein LY79DRAFT_9996 [Colletotrichum navitas]KAK1600180.1 hypothetical protein LY79DRAFT_9996 [Colletotrichum navitas]